MNSAKNRIESILQSESLDLNREVVQTVMDLSKGDMRKVINLFQSIYLQFSNHSNNSNRIETEGGIGSDCTVEHVYKITGVMSPEKIRIVFESLMNDDLDLCRRTTRETMKNSDANVGSLIPYLTDLVLENIHGEDQKMLKIELLAVLENVEMKAAKDISESLLLDYLISQFYLLRCKK
jgi:DNA polymerase III delta prime subunit